MAKVTISVRGPLRITGPDGAQLDGLGRRGQALLAYLSLMDGGAADRSYLADLLWSDRADAQARASLRQELSQVRRHLPTGVLEADRQRIWLIEGAVDVLRDGTGDLLQGFDLRSEGFEDWLRDLRQRDTVSAPTPSRSDRPTLAVLPFEDLGGGDDDVFADGVVEEITGALSQVRDFDVIARQSAFALGTAPVDHAVAADRLGADYLVEGSIRRAGERVRISVHLIDGGTGRTLWSERFDDRLDDLFDLQDRIAGRVAGQIQPSLRAEEIARAGRCNRETSSAYELTLTGLPHFWSHRAEGNRKALSCFDAALARDPSYAYARAMKAWCHAQEAAYIWTDDPATARAEAGRNADLAAENAGNHAPTLVAICAAISLTSDDQARAKTYIDKALRIDPNSAWGWLRSGWLHCLFNQPDAALDHFARSERLSPLDPFLFNIQFGKANAKAELGDLDEAIGLVKRGLAMAPGASWAYRMLAAYCGMKGDAEGAAEAVRTYLTHYPGMTIARMKASMPPSILLTQKAYFEGMRRAGMPET